MKHRWNQRRWWATIISSITRNGNTQTCARCGSQLRAIKQQGPHGRERTVLYYRTDPKGLAQIVTRIPPCPVTRTRPC